MTSFRVQSPRSGYQMRLLAVMASHYLDHGKIKRRRRMMHLNLDIFFNFFCARLLLSWAVHRSQCKKHVCERCASSRATLHQEDKMKQSVTSSANHKQHHFHLSTF
ncbi:unnamed protein product [Ectocarpus sp. 4 AP-2014]